MQTTILQAAVVGAGPTGLVAALALAKSGFMVAIVAPPYKKSSAAKDLRTTALIGPSVDLLRNLGVWQRCQHEAEELTGVRIVDDRRGIIRSPEVLFAAGELGAKAFGANIPNTVLLAALIVAVENDPSIQWISTSAVTQIEPGLADVRLKLTEGGAVTAALAVAADGRNSIATQPAGIAVRTWEYPQAAIITNFQHSRAHNGIVNELHRRSGPLTTVPLPGFNSSLVWSEAPDEARRLVGLGDTALAELLERQLHGVLGEITEIGPRVLYPLSGAAAERLAARRIVLVGEAAHVIPPIGAQGLNLGLRDAAALAECASETRRLGFGLGSEEMLAAYQQARGADVAIRSTAVDLLNRSLLQDFLPFEVLRGAAVHAIASSSALRHLLMRGGMGAAGNLPRLMRPIRAVSA